MEEKIYKVKLAEINTNDCLVFEIDGDIYNVNLNSEDQETLKKLFFKIINLTFSFKPTFVLSEEAENYPIQIFIEISKEYLKDLNSEIEKIMENNPNFEEVNN